MSERHKDISNSSKRIATNTLVLFARMLVLTFVNLYTVRLVLAGLGTEDYGIFNAIAGVVTASTCISSVLALSTQRFYSYAIGKRETERLQEIFSVSLNICLLMSVCFIFSLNRGSMAGFYSSHHSTESYGSCTATLTVFLILFYIYTTPDTIYWSHLCP